MLTTFPRPWERSEAAAAEFASFTWPLTTVAEVKRLLTASHIRPTWLLLGERHGTWGASLETRRGVVTLAVDQQAPTTVCLAYQGAFQDVLHLAEWDGLCAWPSCTHQAHSNGPLLSVKSNDGRMFFGLVGVLYVLFAGSARVRMVEQPLTTLGAYLRWPHLRLTTTQFGDVHRKTIVLYLIGMSFTGLAEHHRPAAHVNPRLPHWMFANDDERQDYRSSWAHFPLSVLALILCMSVEYEVPSPPSFAEQVEAFAVAWHRAGYPVPEGYDAADGLPPTEEARAYQLTSGRGDGRLVQGVIPKSLRASDDLVLSASTNVAPPPPPPFESDLPLAIAGLSADQLIFIRDLTVQGFMLFFVTTLLQPLVFAHLSGMRVLGAELPLTMSPKTTSLRVIEHWAKLAWGATASATTFMVGRYLEGPRVGVTVIPFQPAEDDIIRTPQGRERALKRGRRFAWFTLSALAGCALADPAARVFASVEAFRRPVYHLADELLCTAAEGGTPFVFGGLCAANLVSAPRLRLLRTPGETLLAEDAYNAMLLREACLQGVSEGCPLLVGWAERIRPPEVDLHDELASLRPDYSDVSLLEYHFAPVYVPPTTAWLLRMPAQLDRSTPFCVTSPMQLLTRGAERRVHTWLDKLLDQLDCIDRGGEHCELLRPGPLAIGQGGQKPWARGVVWDFTFERASCAIPLDFGMPIESDLDLAF